MRIDGIWLELARLFETVALCVMVSSCSSLPAPNPVNIVKNASVEVRVFPDGGFNVAGGGGQKVVGNLGVPIADPALASGKDMVGLFRSLTFSYAVSGNRRGEIRIYQDHPIVLFTETYLQPGPNESPFPSFAAIQPQFSHLTFTTPFGRPSFTDLPEDGPWVFFDSQANAMVFSAASQFQVSSTHAQAGAGFSFGIDPAITQLPQGFSHSTVLVMGRGINSTIEEWGRFITQSQNKIRPSNDADRVLKYFGYWTDNGATYYYHTDPALDYQGTLLAVRDDFARHGIPLGYMELDSWFYPKGPTQGWNSPGGISLYIGAPALFPGGLVAFQQQLHLPLVTQARWIDATSPYRRQFTISGNVAVDPAYWNMISTQLQAAGVQTYDQDWLLGPAQTEVNLTDSDAFFDNMAKSMAQKAITIQYWGPRGRDFMQTSRYPNVTAIRTSTDRFQRSHWDDFLYGSRLASGLGVWPWSDVFMSSEGANLLLSVLSAGPVGVGDAIGTVNAQNIQQAIRLDGVIVKPDVPLVPLDQTILNDALGLQRPMLASTFTDFGNLKYSYVFGYARGPDTAIEFRPSELGTTGSVYVYSFASASGQVLNANAPFTDDVAGEFVYYLVSPIGPSGMALLGDTQQLVPIGKKRISSISDNGTLAVTVEFASGETSRTLRLYAPTLPSIRAVRGGVGNFSYDISTHLLLVTVSPGPSGDAALTFQ